MPLSITCPGCGKKLKVGSGIINEGKTLCCPGCKIKFRIELSVVPIQGTSSSCAIVGEFVQCPRLECNGWFPFDPMLSGNSVTCPHCNASLQQPDYDDATGQWMNYSVGGFIQCKAILFSRNPATVLLQAGEYFHKNNKKSYPVQYNYTCPYCRQFGGGYELTSGTLLRGPCVTRLVTRERYGNPLDPSHFSTQSYKERALTRWGTFLFLNQCGHCEEVWQQVHFCARFVEVDEEGHPINLDEGLHGYPR